MIFRKKLRQVKKKWSEISDTWVGTAVYAALGIMFAILLNYFLGVFLATSLPVVTVSSGSMVPTMNVGDIVFIQSKEFYDPGDIIVFSGWENVPIIHRVVAKISDSGVEKYGAFNEISPDKLEGLAQKGKILYITRGDANPRCDQCGRHDPIPEANIFGHSIFTIPYLGWVKIAFVNMFGDNLFLGIAIIFGISLLYSYIKGKSEE